MAEDEMIMPEDIGDAAVLELDGEKYEVIDTVSLDGHVYIAIVPYEESDELSETTEFTILEMYDDPDNEDNCILKTVDDDELYQRIGDEFLKHIEEFEEE